MRSEHSARAEQSQQSPTEGLRAGRFRARDRRWWAAISGVLVVAVGVAVWQLWPSGRAAYDPPARTRQYVSFTACLLTGPAGLADPAARVVWSGMESASTATRAQVSYLSAPTGAAGTVGSVTPIANSLVQQRCGVIVAVGAVEVATVQSIAAARPSGRFVLVGGGSATGNVVVLPVPGIVSVTSRVDAVVRSAVSGSFHPGVVS